MSDEIPSYRIEGVAKIRREVPEISEMSDDDITEKWEEYSETVCASFLTVDDFWLNGFRKFLQ